MTLLTPRVGLASALAALPRRRDFAFSEDLGRAAWITDEAIEWWDGDGPPGRFPLLAPLPADSNLSLIDGIIGVVRPTDAGAEVAWIDTVSRTSGRVASLATPRTCLLPALPGQTWQVLAVGDFDGTTTLCRVDWWDGSIEEIGGLPLILSGGVWLDGEGRRLAVNLVGDSGRASVHVVDLSTGHCSLLFDGAPGSEDRAVAYDPGLDTLAVTTNAPGHAAVALARLGPGTVDLLPSLLSGDEAGVPVGFVTVPGGARRLLLRHEVGAHSRLLLADPATLEVSAPLPVPDGEVGLPVAVSGSRARFSYSTHDLPWRTAWLDLADGPPRFSLDPEPDPGPDPEAAHEAAPGTAPRFQPGREMTFPGPAGDMPAVVLEPAGPGGDLAVVALHGGPFARWSAAFNPELQLFAHLGLAVYGLDYPGSTGSGQRLVNALLGRGGEIDVAAVCAVCDAVEAETGRSVVLYGESYGAYLALAVAAVRPAAGVIAFAPFASFERLRASGSPAVVEMLELLDSGKFRTKGRNVVDRCRNVPSKVLIAHGTADKTIPVEESRALAAALQERHDSGENGVQLVELDGQGHELVGRSALELWYWELAGFVGGLPVRDRLPNEWHQQQGR